MLIVSSGENQVSEQRNQLKPLASIDHQLQKKEIKY
jgi:hypothetical protein